MQTSENEFTNENANKGQYSLFEDESERDELCFDIFFKDGPFAIIILDRFFQVNKVNEKFTEIFSQSSAQSYGRSIYEFLHSEDALKLKSIFENRDSIKSPLLLHLHFINRKGNGFFKMDTYVKKYTNRLDEVMYCLLMFDQEFCPDPDWMDVKQEVYKSIVDTQEQERKRIGHQLHDSVAQLLYATRLNLEHFAQENHEHAAIIRPIKKMLNDAIHEVRNVSIDLVPSVLHAFGLKAAITAMTERISMPDFTVETSLPIGVEELDKDMKLVIYRIVQELLNNTLKHSSANRVQIIIRNGQDQLEIEVKDNGQGFPSDLKESKRMGSGLRTIENRTDLYKGKLSVISSDKGSSVLVTLNKD
ncbi:sensor histidine kinase [Sphingobacterium sp. 1.A.4]|uniref:sensor histidine kinase n=1 Tax=Sphingobacterium sp. 1.A.4 TaxID=2044603 RepID=UPI000C0BE035|nr:sensor histidine kinase [Sphingobacterium sp. 1.A.4]